MSTPLGGQPVALLCALCTSQQGPESTAVTIAAGYAVCRRHRNAIMSKDQGDLIEWVLFETRQPPPPPGPESAERFERQRPERPRPSVFDGVRREEGRSC